MTNSVDYKAIAARKVCVRDKNFWQEWLVDKSQLPLENEARDVLDWINKSGCLTAKEVEITESSATTIVENVKNRHWRAVEVTKAFCHRASIAHQLVNCLSEVFFDQAVADARKLDHWQDKTGQVKGPMHGLPVSLKDNFNVKGQATTLGIVDNCFKPAEFDEDAALATILRGLGAVLYTKTNVPVAMMMPETNNHVYGETCNPFNRLLSAGGSSGGEAALLALKGSPLGVGTDIGGSIRIPASFENLYSLKPTFGRFPTYGCRSGLPGLESVNSVNGPISTSIETLEFYCKNIIGLEPWLFDAKVVNFPWRQVTLPEKLNFAVLDDDGVVRPTAPIRRGVKIVIEKLKAAGHEVIEWNPAEHLRLSQIIAAFFLSDGAKHVKQVVEATGEPLFPYMEPYGTATEMGVAELWDLHAERTTLINKFLERWNQTAAQTSDGRPIDALILPASPFPGNPKGKFHDYVGYTSPFNLIDVAAGTFPVTRVDKHMDVRDSCSHKNSATDTKVWQDYDPEESHGGAVALQIVARRFEEEKLIEMMKVISKIVDYKH